MKSIFLVGTGRSGTTWVANVINHDKRFRLMFEPFNPRKVKVMKSFRYRQYLRPDNREDKFLLPVQKVLFGKIKNEWIDQYKQSSGASGRLVKDIRINHLLKWLKVNFPKALIVLLLRHPCAVVTSKLALKWETHLDEFLSQPDLMSDYLEPFREAIEGAHSDVEKHTLMWAIENYVPLRQFGGSTEMYTVLYEHLCLQPRLEFRKLFSFLGVPFDEGIFKLVQTPFMTRRGSAILSGKDLVMSWRKHLTKGQVDRIMELTNLFGFGDIYSES